MVIKKSSLHNLIPSGAVDFGLQNIRNKDEVIVHLSDLLFSCGKIKSLEGFIKAVHKRESMGKTLIKSLLAFPHAVSSCVTSPGIACGLSEHGVLYESNKTPEYAKIIFLIALPKDETKDKKALDVLKQVTYLFLEPSFIAKVVTASNYGELISFIQKDLIKYADFA